ncbi:MAG: InlB B-repeat-containing protein [Lachnospiraceae bacterium]|nr:InlB B-repeat-containing protein [Lachnospiraceae bacterium]
MNDKCFHENKLHEKTVIDLDSQSEKENTPPKRELRGLYKHVKISVRTLDCIIVGCVLVIVTVLAFSLIKPGFTVSFDSNGGTDVASQKQMYGETLDVPEAPSREGYEFIGWCKDYACDELWNEEVDKIEGDVTLYAEWKKIEE